MPQLRPLPSLKYGHLPTFLDSRSFSLPSNRRMVITPNIHKHPSYYLTSATHVSVNPGDGPGIARLPAINRAILLGSGIWPRNKPLAQYSQQDVINAINGYINQIGAFDVVTDQFGETYGNDVPWNLSPDMPQYEWTYRALDAAIFAITGRHFDAYAGYGGHLRVESVTSDFNKGAINGKRTAFTDNTAALAFAKDASGTGDRYFISEHWKFRSGMINAYYTGWTTPGKRLFQYAANMHIEMRAKAAVGAGDSRTMVFCWPMKQDFNGHHSVYRCDVPGGYIEAESFSAYSPDWQLAMGFMVPAQGCDLYLWETGVEMGTDPTILQPDRTVNDPSGESYRKYFGTGNPVRETALTHYDPSRSPGFVSEPYGHLDMWYVGVEWYCAAVAYAGAAWHWAAHRAAGTQTWRTDVNGNYVLDSYLDDTLLAMVFDNGTRQVLWAVDAGSVPGVWRTWEFQVAGQTFTAEMHGMSSYIWFF